MKKSWLLLLPFCWIACVSETNEINGKWTTLEVRVGNRAMQINDKDSFVKAEIRAAKALELKKDSLFSFSDSLAVEREITMGFFQLFNIKYEMKADHQFILSFPKTDGGIFDQTGRYSLDKKRQWLTIKFDSTTQLAEKEMKLRIILGKDRLEVIHNDSMTHIFRRDQ